MMKKLIFIFLLISISGFSQSKKQQIAEIKKFQKELNEEYLNPEETPLRGDNYKNFKKHPFFPINLKYRVVAKFIRTKDAVAFDMPTSSGKTKRYEEYAKVEFVLDGKKYVLSVYQSHSLRETEEFKDYLFLPFRDLSNGVETYGGGRYLDLKIPNSEEIIIDFNKAYHPLCAYNAFDYNCPIVPEVNKLNIKIPAGVMYEDIYHH